MYTQAETRTNVPVKEDTEMKSAALALDKKGKRDLIEFLKRQLSREETEEENASGRPSSQERSA